MLPEPFSLPARVTGLGTIEKLASGHTSNGDHKELDREPRPWAKPMLLPQGEVGTSLFSGSLVHFDVGNYFVNS